MPVPPHEPPQDRALPATTYDRAAVDRIGDEQVDWRFKAAPTSWWGRTLADAGSSGSLLSELVTPLITLTRPALDTNIAALASFCADRGMGLSPHGKTTMAPQLWAEQIDAGAYAITVANTFQAGVAHAHGVQRVIIANEVISPAGCAWLVRQLTGDPDFEVCCWVDSVAGVERMTELLRREDGSPTRPLDVLVELGGPGGRAGVRDVAEAVDVAESVTASPALRLVGLAGYEGALAHGTDDESLAVLRAYMQRFADTHRALADLYPPQVTPMLTAAGSAYFDVVADGLAEFAEDCRVVLRSGAYITHDSVHYDEVSPLGAHQRVAGQQLRSALQGWGRVQSVPEPGLAIVEGGKRDFPYDIDLPVPQRITTPDGGVREVADAQVSAMNDQHTFLRFDASGNETAPEVGDLVRFGLSHPCTSFDKWSLLPVIDDPDADDPEVVGLIRTYF